MSGSASSKRRAESDAPPACARIGAARTAESKPAQWECAATVEEGDFLPLAKWDVAPITPVVVSGGCIESNACDELLHEGAMHDIMHESKHARKWNIRCACGNQRRGQQARRDQ
eukprot:11719130-Prorocentrum_lima.AAC.1